ncbi:MAG: filamentous hemagglutinin N-terminal domain-containing protein [Oscillatoriophycideae cyanobacterium NC_groundwater_1537_Pr4_S-0.65um_50_18]|nr:filamentous hemagglutinin N-terminal domain-containing protein [Oscillatoriophycideae cyanobacterium NC_groundwater_1537_Pr4_S-0.65um_50_18]
MAQKWKQNIQYLVTLATLTGVGIFPSLPAAAQIVPDNSLGAERSTISPGIDRAGQAADMVVGGARRGGNLFHSFQEFNVGNLQRVYFANPEGVRNILSRVTGTNPSNILGTLGVLGNANLFLINPNGILFGANARLDVGGAFVASTASRIGFADGTGFSTTDPSAASLLTISAPIGLQYEGSPGSLQVQGATLEVPAGQTLALVGGDVTVDGGRLRAPGGRIELASIATSGTVDLIANSSPLLLSFPAATPRADIAITGGSEVNVHSDGSGHIVLNARNLSISGESRIRAGIEPGMRFGGAQVGDIEINTTQATSLDFSSVLNEVSEGGIGNGGDVIVTTGTLSLTGGAALGNVILGTGSAGNVVVNARDTVSLDGVGRNESSVIASAVAPMGNGNAGNVIITAASVRVTGGAGLAASTFGAGNGGNVRINARNAIHFDGVGSNGNSSGAYSQVVPTSTSRGNGGNITITTGSLFVTRGAQVETSTGRVGEAGNIIINARDIVRFDGIGSDGISSAARSINAGVDPRNGTVFIGIGDGGDITITARSLRITGSALLSASTFGAGDGGNIIINALDTVILDGSTSSISSQVSDGRGDGGNIVITTRSLSVTNGAELATDTSGIGNAGNIFINAFDTVQFAGVGSDGVPSVARSNVEGTGRGNGGNISITARSLSLAEGAQFSVSTLAAGNAGNVIINAYDAVRFDRSAIFSSVEENSTGNGGNIQIKTGSLSLLNGSQLLANTGGQGDSGDVRITARDTVLFDGGSSPVIASGIINTVGSNAAGNGGEITIQAPELILRSNAAINSDVDSTDEVSGRGRGGDVNLNIEGTISILGGGTAPTGESARITLALTPNAIGSGGNLSIRAGALVMRDGGLIKVSTQGQGDAGDVFIRTTTTDISGNVPSSGLPSGIFTSSNTVGNAGDIAIKTQFFRIADGAALSARSRGDGQGGDITVNANTSFEAIDGGQLITTAFGQGRAGTITVNTAGQITITGRDSNYTARLSQFPNPISGFVANDIRETGPASGFYANTEPNSAGQGGDIRTTARQMTIGDGAQVTASSNGSGSAGNIRFSAAAIRLDNQASIASNTIGGQGNITLRSFLLTLSRNSSITTNAEGTGTGGNIDVDTDFILSSPNGNNDIIANAERGSGGQVTLTAEGGILGFDLRTREDLQGLLNTTNPNELNPRNLPTNDVAAFSQANPRIDRGTVTIQNPDFDPTQGINALPTDLNDPSALIAATCTADEGNSFAITGRGGLPEDPRQPLMGQDIWQDERGTGTGEAVEQPRTEEPIVEAQRWIVDHTGTVVLVAQPGRSAALRYLSCATSSASSP